MALKVKAKEQYQNIGKYAGKYRYVMMPELYTALTQDKVIKEAAAPRAATTLVVATRVVTTTMTRTVARTQTSNFSSRFNAAKPRFKVL